jgi:hypothetical protein
MFAQLNQVDISRHRRQPPRRRKLRRSPLEDLHRNGSGTLLTYLTAIQYTDESRPIIESDKLGEERRRRGIESERLYGKKLITR